MPDLTQITGHVRQLAARIVRGRRVVVVCAVTAAATARVAELQQQGAEDILVLSLGRGTGPVPDPDSARCMECRGPSISSVADEIRAWQGLVDAPPREAVTALEDFDPDGDAVVLVLTPVVVDTFQGRETWGGRPAGFQALEDKTLSQGLWTAAGVDHVPEEVCRARRDSVRETAARLDQGSGTVWSADASDGFNGGADRVFWVTDETSARTAYEALSACAAKVRVMPFLDGVPCSIHGLVLPNGVAVLRPVELVVLRQPGQPKFLYAGLSSAWDPAPADRETMRGAARRVGHHLQQDHDYRGAFGIDGVLTADGFRPHELNPRFAGGISTIGKSMPDLPLNQLHDLLLRGVALGVSAADLEAAVVARADGERFGAVYTSTRRAHPAETTLVQVAGEPARLEVATAGEPVVGSLEIGPHASGALVRLRLDELPGGTRLAPWAIGAFGLADRLWDTDFGRLEIAPDLRRRDA